MTISGLGSMQDRHILRAEISRDMRERALGNPSEKGVL